MGHGADLAAKYRQQYPWISGADVPSGEMYRGGSVPGSWDLADWLGSATAYGGLEDVQQYIPENPQGRYEDFAMDWAAMEMDARERELESQAQQMEMMERLMPYEEKMRQQEIANARSRQAWEDRIRGFLEPLTEGEQLPGMFKELGQPATEEEIRWRFGQLQPAIDERLTQLGLGYSGATPELYSEAAKDITMGDITRARGEQMNLMNAMQGMPYQGSPAANVSPIYSSQLGSAIGTGAGITANELARQAEAARYNQSMQQIQDYNEMMGSGWRSWLPAALDVAKTASSFIPGGGGGSGSFMSSMFKNQNPASSAMNRATGGTYRFR